MRVYLAGKMDSKHGAWRDEIIGSAYHAASRKTLPRWILPHAVDANYDLDDLSVPPWPWTENAFVLGIHEYVGPYRWIFAPVEPQNKHLGYFRRRIVEECSQAIGRADLVFAYLNSPDCFGTLVEIGMAKALGKFVYVAIEQDAEWDGTDYWFVQEMSDAGRFLLGAHFVGQRLVGVFKDAIVAWTGRAPKLAPVELVRQDDSQRLLGALSEAANSFAQIGRWSADPRVRNEAQRMLKRIAG
jgi:hypothetical protein